MIARRWPPAEQPLPRAWIAGGNSTNNIAALWHTAGRGHLTHSADMAKKTTLTLPLCHRCEYRAQYCETGHGPRHQCSLVGKAVLSCYMYRPVYPLVIKRNAGDLRPMAGPGMIAARCHAIAIADDLEPVLVSHGGGYTITLHKAP